VACSRFKAKHPGLQTMQEGTELGRCRDAKSAHRKDNISEYVVYNEQESKIFRSIG